MKKTIIMAVIAIISTATVSAQIKIGVKAGALENNQRVRSSNGHMYAGEKFKGYQAGFIADVPMAYNVHLQTGLQFARKGMTLKTTLHAADINVKMNYLELPVSFLYKVPLPFGNAFLGAGATFSYGIGGKVKENGISKNLYNNEWRREDLSAHATAGVDFNNGLFASFSTQKGLLDIHKAGNLDIKNRSMTVTVGYLLDWKKFKRRA